MGSDHQLIYSDLLHVLQRCRIQWGSEKGNVNKQVFGLNRFHFAFISIEELGHTISWDCFTVLSILSRLHLQIPLMFKILLSDLNIFNNQLSISLCTVSQRLKVFQNISTSWSQKADPLSSVIPSFRISGLKKRPLGIQLVNSRNKVYMKWHQVLE